ncbi:MAG: PLP-dependent aminotransferase family protein [Candidatus Puniceispirillaceae bacterium]
MLESLIFTLDPEAKTSLQMQIRQIFVEAILKRILLPGDKLPSSRALSAHLSVSRNTVNHAYQALMDSEYIEARPRSGYVVSAAAPVGRLEVASSHSDSHATDHASDVDWQAKLIAPLEEVRLVKKPLNWRDYEFPFIYGQTDSTLFAHSQWRDCSRQALGLRDFGNTVGDFGYHDDPMLVNYICSRSLPRRGIQVVSDQLLVTLGAQNALYLVAQLLIDSDKTVVLEEPSYPDLRDIVARRTNNILSLPVDEEGMILDESVLSQADIICITPSHQCPTTTTMSVKRRKDLLEMAKKHDFLIIEDDYEFEMNFIEKPSPALKSLDRSGHVIYVGSLSKSLFPGLRLGYLVASQPLIDQARSLRHLILRHPPGHTQRTAAYFLALGHYEAQLRRLRRHLHGRREILQEALDKVPLFEQTASHFGGTSFWIKGPDWLDSRALAMRAAKQGVLIEAGDVFFAPENPPLNYFRIAYSSIPSEKIPDGIDRLAQILSDMQQEHHNHI